MFYIIANVRRKDLAYVFVFFHVQSQIFCFKEHIVNKGELIANVAKAVNSNKQEVGKVLDAILDEVLKSLKEGNDVTLVGFGTWKKKSRAARTGRNPQTGETIEIPAKNTVTFTAGKSLKDSVN